MIVLTIVQTLPLPFSFGGYEYHGPFSICERCADVVRPGIIWWQHHEFDMGPKMRFDCVNALVNKGHNVVKTPIGSAHTVIGPPAPIPILFSKISVECPKAANSYN